MGQAALVGPASEVDFWKIWDGKKVWKILSKDWITVHLVIDPQFLQAQPYRECSSSSTERWGDAEGPPWQLILQYPSPWGTWQLITLVYVTLHMPELLRQPGKSLHRFCKAELFTAVLSEGHSQGLC